MSNKCHCVNAISNMCKALAVPAMKGPDFAGRNRFFVHSDRILRNRAIKGAFCQCNLYIWESIDPIRNRGSRTGPGSGSGSEARPGLDLGRDWRGVGGGTERSLEDLQGRLEISPQSCWQEIEVKKVPFQGLLLLKIMQFCPKSVLGG